MPHAAVSSATPGPDHLSAAADWYLRLSEGVASAADRRAWQAWHDQAAEHRAAWQRVERLKALLAQAPAQATQTLARAPRGGRRRLLAGAGLLGLGLLCWRLLPPWEVPVQWEQSAAGQRREVTLPDGGLLLLAPDSRVGVAYGPRERKLVLDRGALQLHSGHDPKGRPLRVVSRDGEVRPLGTRFTLEQQAQGSLLAVQEAAVEVQPAQRSAVWRVEAGQRLRFDASGAGPLQAASAADDAWTRGQVVALEQPLGVFLQALQRQSGQAIGCDPALAGVPVSGVFLAAEPQRSLATLAQQHGWRLQRRGAGWHLAGR